MGDRVGLGHQWEAALSRNWRVFLPDQDLLGSLEEARDLGTGWGLLSIYFTQLFKI